MTMQGFQAILPALIAFTALISRADEPTPIDPSKWDAEIAAFAERDAKTPPPKGGLLFVGSSTIRMWDLETSWPGEEVLKTPMLGPDGGMPSANWFKEDGLHLSPKGYAEWTKVISGVLREAGVLK